MTHASPAIIADKPRRPGGPTDPHAFEEPHVSLRVYFTVFAALMIMLVATIAAAFLPHHTLGFWSTIIALTIATIKALLVILYFMHVKYASPLVRIFVIAGFVWLAIAMGLTFSDYLTRPWLPQSAGWQDNPIRADRALPDPVPGEGHASGREGGHH
jgi:cytochrome c oxidase subunit 4